VTDRVSDPLVFAHRGSSEALPEHTIDAYRRAIEEGADGVECDVRLTRDGHLVCIHDSRLERTSNGRGRVSAATLDDLERLDFSWRAPDASKAARASGSPVVAAAKAEAAESGEVFGVLTLDRLLATVKEAGRPLRLLIETKHPSRFGSAVEERLVELLGRYGLAGADPAAPVQVTVMSFSPLALRTVRALAPKLPAVFLFELALRRVRDGRPPFGARILGPGVATLRERPDLVRRAHERGHQVYVWTVNEPEDIDLVVRLGVDGIISDRPAFVLARLGR
jgi:glycerophosphoryl diester phosphodiesterase